MRQPPSPCTGICRIAPATGRCEGCARSLAEIADWPMMTAGEKEALLLRLVDRSGAAEEGRRR